MGTTLREALEANFEQIVEDKDSAAQGSLPATDGTLGDKGADNTSTTEASSPAAAETAEQKAGRTAGRPRDSQGRLLPGKAQRETAAEPGKASPAPTPNAQTVQTAPAAGSVSQAIPRPSSWKKDYWEHWDKLDPKLAAYIAQRETEAVKGVSTYKAEFDRLKPLDEAMRTLEPTLRQHGQEPVKWLQQVGQAHQTLAQGTPQQKLGMLAKLAQDYQIPLQHLFVQGQDGRMYPNPQVQAYQPQQQQAPQPDVAQLIDKALTQRQVTQTIAQFEAEVPTKYPHYEAVKQTMVGLLQAELATDLEDAYGQALKHPRHSDIYAGIQEQEAQAKAAQEAQEKTKQVARARSQAVSPKGSTPSASQGPAAKGIRAALERNFDEHLGGGGRV